MNDFVAAAGLLDLSELFPEGHVLHRNRFLWTPIAEMRELDKDTAQMLIVENTLTFGYQLILFAARRPLSFLKEITNQQLQRIVELPEYNIGASFWNDQTQLRQVSDPLQRLDLKIMHSGRTRNPSETNALRSRLIAHAFGVQLGEDGQAIPAASHATAVPDLPELFAEGHLLHRNPFLWTPVANMAELPSGTVEMLSKNGIRFGYELVSFVAKCGRLSELDGYSPQHELNIKSMRDYGLNPSFWDVTPPLIRSREYLQQLERNVISAVREHDAMDKLDLWPRLIASAFDVTLDAQGKPIPGDLPILSQSVQTSALTTETAGGLVIPGEDTGIDIRDVGAVDKLLGRGPINMEMLDLVADGIGPRPIPLEDRPVPYRVTVTQNKEDGFDIEVPVNAVPKHRGRYKSKFMQAAVDAQGVVIQKDVAGFAQDAIENHDDLIDKAAKDDDDDRVVLNDQDLEPIDPRFSCKVRFSLTAAQTQGLTAQFMTEALQTRDFHNDVAGVVEGIVAFTRQRAHRDAPKFGSD